MKILINGNSLSECFTISNNDNELKILDKQIGLLRKVDKKQYKRLIVLVAIFVLPTPIKAFALTSNPFDPAGFAIFELVVSIAKWVFIAKGGWEIIQNMATGCDIGDISTVVAKYGMGYGAIIMLPKVLTLLGNAISKVAI